MTQQWDVPVDEPVNLQAWHVRNTDIDLEAALDWLSAGATLRILAGECGISHEILR